MTGNTALQIYFNPDDLIFCLGKEEGGGDSWIVIITRGPRSKKRPFMDLLSSDKDAHFTKEQALAAIEMSLNSAKKFGDEMFTDGKCELIKILVCGSQFSSKEQYVASCGPVLEDADIEKIMAELKGDEMKEGGCSETFKWDNWYDRYPKQEVRRRK